MVGDKSGGECKILELDQAMQSFLVVTIALPDHSQIPNYVKMSSQGTYGKQKSFKVAWEVAMGVKG